MGEPVKEKEQSKCCCCCCCCYSVVPNNRLALVLLAPSGLSLALAMIVAAAVNRLVPPLQLLKVPVIAWEIV